MTSIAPILLESLIGVLDRVGSATSAPDRAFAKRAAVLIEHRTCLQRERRVAVSGSDTIAAGSLLLEEFNRAAQARVRLQARRV